MNNIITRAVALILAIGLISALLWFVSYKNGCVSCSKTDADEGTPRAFAACSSCFGCASKTDAEDEDAADKTTPVINNNIIINGDDIDVDGTGSDSDVTKAPDDAAAPADDTQYVEPAQTEPQTISFEVVIDGKATRFTVDMDGTTGAPVTVTSDDGNTVAAFEKGFNSDVRVTINSLTTEAAPAPVEETADENANDTTAAPAVDALTLDTAPVEIIIGDTTINNTTVQGDSDIAAVPVSETVSDTEIPATTGKDDAAIEAANKASAFNTPMPAVALFDGEGFGMEGKVLALGKGSTRRDVIVAVEAPEGTTVALLCESRTTQKTINAVSKNYPRKHIYTYTIDREFFANLRGESRFTVYNYDGEIEIEAGLEVPEWLDADTTEIPADQIDLYRIKNELERNHVKGTKGCLVIAESNDIFRYNWDKCGNYEMPV